QGLECVGERSLDKHPRLWRGYRRNRTQRVPGRRWEEVVHLRLFERNRSQHLGRAGVSTPLAITDRDGRRTLVLSRPDRGNSLSDDLVDLLHRALDEAERNGTRLLVIEGAGRNFCTGF